jgi:Helicase conserved C-terminal domain
MLQAIIIDEVHQVVVSSSFRPVMNRACALRSLGLPLILLTGTCPRAFEGSILASLKSSHATCTVLRSEDDPTFLRRSINLLMVSDPKSAMLDLLEVNHKGRTMVFSMTKHESQEVAAKLRERFGSDTEVLQLDSDAVPGKREEILSRVTSIPADNEGSLIVSCTKLLAEGVDAASFNRVIVLAGAHAGVTDIVQMFGRGGRGANGLDVEAFLFYNKDMATRVAYCGKAELLRSSDAQNVDAFLQSDQAGVEAVVTFAGIEDLFTGEMHELCGRIALKRFMDSPLNVTESPCGTCSRCAGVTWRWSNVFKKYIVGVGVSLTGENFPKSIPGTESKATSHLAGPGPRLRIVRDEEEGVRTAKVRKPNETTTKIREAIQSLGNSCIICRKSTGKGAPHFPNECSVLMMACFSRTYVKTGHCRSCFNSGHKVEDVSLRLQQLSSLKSERQALLEAKRKDPLINECAVVYDENALYGRFKPCTECWLQHNSREEGGACFTFKATVRACFLMVWHSSNHKKRFISLMRNQGALTASRRMETWSDFLTWGVYEGCDVQNAYLVVSYVLNYFRV